MKIPSVGGDYSKELKRLFVFAHLVLPVFSLFSMLTGWYFLSHKILPSIIPQTDPMVHGIISVLIVSLVEAGKYFVIPLVSKSTWRRDFFITASSLSFFLILFF